MRASYAHLEIANASPRQVGHAKKVQINKNKEKFKEMDTINSYIL